MTLIRLLLAAVLLGGAAGPARADTVNRIVAIVNDDVITQADVDAYLASVLEEQDPPPDAEPAQLRGSILRRIIEQRVILQEARRQGITVETDDISQRLEELRKRFESEEAFRQSLEESRLSMEQLKEQLRDQLMVQRLIETKIRAAITVSPFEIAKELEAHPELARVGDRARVSHLLVRVKPGRSAEDALQTVTRLRRQLAEGADFADLARRHSEDPQAQAGGALGWVGRGELLPELDQALSTLRVGEVSEPIQTPLGCHLIKLEEERAAEGRADTETHQAVYQQIYQKKFQTEFSRWLAGLLQRAYIEVLAPSQNEG
ncbi:MAG: peptidylprolyl isomerase [Candidatus Omnitrophica bacterium]|nr:peptidylprolyl isomerase [Candidatus Omnitrophota bacterium]